MDATYRLSIIPAGAVTDPRLEGRDLQVLALLGRHTNRKGWCYRSQVKMAKEIHCGRATIQRSLDRLYRAGWVEHRIRTRADVAADPAHPHTAHAYRVRLDLDTPDEIIFSDEHSDDDLGATGEADSGCPQVGTIPCGQGVPAQDGQGGAHICTGTQVNDDSESAESNGERECARARSEKRHHVSVFLKRWPSAAVDSQEAIKREWAALPDDELQPAIDGIEQFCAELKKHKRSHLPSGATYLRERKWKGLPPPGQVPQSQKIVSFPVWSRDWWAMIFAMADRGESIKFRVDHAKERGTREVSERADRMPPAEVVAGLTAVKATGEWLANWRPWFTARGVNLPFWTESVWVFLPGPFPPERGGKALDGCLREQEQDQSDEFMEANQ